MKDFVSEAIVLGIQPSKEHDRIVSLFTKKHGRIQARVAGGARLLSKFALHLDPINLVFIRVAHKNKFTITDALTSDRFVSTREGQSFGNALKVLGLVRVLAPEGEADMRLWHDLLDAFSSGNVNPNHFLNLFGYDSELGACDSCNEKEVSYFSIKTHELLCVTCSTKLPENALLLL
ncbi:MAG: DNA repair protein RecO [bacterium]|nr:DNA repair protein RecO [Candidatus Jorgensenbacteria bacterium]